LTTILVSDLIFFEHDAKASYVTTEGVTSATFWRYSMAETQDQTQSSFLGDIPVEVVVELGRTRMVLRDLAKLDTDDVVELNQPMDKPLDVVVGGKLIARGELVMVAERMALRITEIVSSSGNPKQ
jgi:flagellar motor switch protein FliN/FliY